MTFFLCLQVYGVGLNGALMVEEVEGRKTGRVAADRSSATASAFTRGKSRQREEGGIPPFS